MKISKFEENSLRNYQEYCTRIETHRKSWEGWKYDKFIKSVSDNNEISLDRKYDKFNQRQTENNINSLGLYYLYNKNWFLSREKLSSNSLKDSSPAVNIIRSGYSFRQGYILL